MSRRNKLAAAQVEALMTDLGRLANFFEYHARTASVPDEVAKDFAWRCDLLSKFVEQNAMPRYAAASNGGWDPSQISAYQSGGALEADEDELYMSDNFTEIETQELQVRHQRGDIGRGDPKGHRTRLARRRNAYPDYY